MVYLPQCKKLILYIKHLEDDTGENHCNPRLVKEFLDVTPKV